LEKSALPNVCLIFEVHQPLRLSRNFHANLLTKPQIRKSDLFDLYFDSELNREVFERAARKCYFPANNIILEQIDRFKHEWKQFKVAYSISGVFIEQCERWNPSLIESFRQLAQTGRVEFFDETYYHSLSSLFSSDRSEFVEQVQMHRQLMKDLFNYEPRICINTECIYNNPIAKTIENMGYEATVTEGVEKILQWRSPNYVYKAKASNLRVLLRNYSLSDDIGFRFTARWWNEWPLTAQKYSSWLAASQGQVITLFMDYETLGEHHWPESGIHEFLRWLPGEVIKWNNLNWALPIEVVRWHQPVDEIDVNEYSSVSWADLERDITAWLVNPMQWVCYNRLKQSEPLVKQIGDADLIRLWRYLQISDHLYYLSLKGGGPGDVHSYFNPLGSPLEAFTVYSSIISDFEARVMIELEKPEWVAQRILRSFPVERGFTFFYEFARPTQLTATSLEEFTSALKVVDLKAVEFHTERGDFERWIRHVLGDDTLANGLKEIADEKLHGEALRKKTINVLEQRIRELKAMKKATKTRFNQPST
jgi:alpha-amylase